MTILPIGCMQVREKMTGRPIWAITSVTPLPKLIMKRRQTSERPISAKINGTLKKCDGSNVTNGYVIVPRNGGDQVINVSNGTFGFNAMFCNSATFVSLRGVDLDNLQTVTVDNHAVTTPVTDIGNLTACNSLSNYVRYKIDDQPTAYFFTGLFGGWNSPTLPFAAGTTTGDLHVVGNTTVPGVYDSSVFQLYDYVGNYYSYANENLTYNLIAFGNVGELLEMT